MKFHNRLLSNAVCLALVLGLTACEAPLVLDAVEAKRAEPVHRTDRYQAAARHESNVVVVGNQGVILRSGDSGSNWTRMELENWPAMIDVVACPNGSFVALAYDRLIFVSTDGGIGWQAKSINDTEETPQSITCAPDNRIWVVGSFTYIWSSADFGDTWTETSREEDAILTTVQFFDADTGIITGEFGTALKTVDGGDNWEQLPPLPGEFYPQEAWFRDAMRGWVIGLGGTIYYTEDGAQSWTAQPSGTQVSLFGIEAVGDTLFVVGGEGIMLRFKDDAWRPFEHGKPVRLYLRAIEALGSDRFLIGGIAGTLHIVDIEGA